MITGGAFHSGLAPVIADSNGATLFVYVNSDGTVAFIPNTQPGLRVCLAINRPGFGEFRNGLVRLLVANVGEECGDNYLMAELADNEDAHYVYLDRSGEVVLSQSEVAPPDKSGSGH